MRMRGEPRHTLVSGWCSKSMLPGLPGRYILPLVGDVTGCRERTAGSLSKEEATRQPRLLTAVGSKVRSTLLGPPGTAKMRSA